MNKDFLLVRIWADHLFEQKSKVIHSLESLAEPTMINQDTKKGHSPASGRGWHHPINDREHPAEFSHLTLKALPFRHMKPASHSAAQTLEAKFMSDVLPECLLCANNQRACIRAQIKRSAEYMHSLWGLIIKIGLEENLKGHSVYLPA